MPKATSNRLSSIANRNSNRVRDAFFAACVALVTTVSFITVTTASNVASAQPTTAQHTSR